MSNQYKFDETTGKWRASGVVLSGVNSVNGLAGDVTYLPAGIVTTTTGDVSPSTYARIYTGDTAPSVPKAGDIWIDSTYGSGMSNIVRWRKIASGGETSLSSTDDFNTLLIYTPGYEQVYINGILQYRGSDYVATTGTTITGLTALSVSDVVEVIAPSATQVGDFYTQAQIAALLASTTPIGTVNSFAGASAPTGWLLCDNQPFSSITYPGLAALLGDTYGTHSGTNYYKPDLRGRVPAGVDNMGGAAANRLTVAGAGFNGTLLNASGGVQSVSTSNHTHAHMSAIGLNSGQILTINPGEGQLDALGSYNLYDIQTTSMGRFEGATGTTAYERWYVTSSANGSESLNNTQPTIMLNYIIKAI